MGTLAYEKNRKRIDWSVAVMANGEKRIWGIHTTDDSLFLHNNVIAIGWKEFGDCGHL